MAHGGAFRQDDDKEACMKKGLHQDITGVILVGGKSRRMGRDKAFLQIAGKPLFEPVFDLLRESFTRVVLVGDRAERFTGYNLPVLPDIYPGSALGGLYTALYHAETEHIFVSACDLPFPSREILLKLCSLREGFDAVVPSTARGLEPLFAVYAKSCLEPIRVLLESGNFCAYAYYPQIRVRYVTEEELNHFGRSGKSFVNVNTPEEFEKIRKEECT